MLNVSVVISVFSIDRETNVTACVQSVKKQTMPPKEIIVVLDPDQKLVAYYKDRLDPDVKLVVSDAYGLSSARNMGIRNCSSEIVAFIDDDAVAQHDWLANLVMNFDDSSIIGVGGQIVPIWPGEAPSWFPKELFWVIGCSYTGLPTMRAPIRNPIGCNMAFRRSVFDTVGFFSTDIGRVGNKLLGHDDTEFGIRSMKKLSGTKILYDPSAIVYHSVSPNRVSMKYVVARSYAEGFSKAFVSQGNYSKNRSLLNTEKDYLRALLLGVPHLFSGYGIISGGSQAATLLTSTVLVFLGYIMGQSRIK